jgi:hypothetical protein
VLCLAVLLPLGARAQPLVAKGGIDERYTDRAQTSGFLVAGLVQGALDGAFNPDGLGFNAVSASPVGTLCFRLSSRDGRYRGLAEYVQASPSPGFAFLQFKSRFQDQLKALRLSDLAPRLVAAGGCSERTSGTIIPVSLSGGKAGGSLVALINPGDARVSARIIGADGKALTGGSTPCETIPLGANIVYSQICRLTLDPTAERGRAVLELTIVELMSGRSIEKVDIQLFPQ